MATVSLSPDELRPLVETVVSEVLRRLDEQKAAIGVADSGRAAWSESEAARMLGLQTHQLRDERRRGRIGASTGPGRRILYTQKDLAEYLASRRWSAN